jgi:hypothetical protein
MTERTRTKSGATSPPVEVVITASGKPRPVVDIGEKAAVSPRKRARRVVTAVGALIDITGEATASRSSKRGRRRQIRETPAKQLQGLRADRRILIMDARKVWREELSRIPTLSVTTERADE